MSAIVSGVLKLTFGFMAQKIRSNIASRLKDGDVTNEECWRLIVRELDSYRIKAVARALIGGGVYSYIQVLPD